MRSQIVATGSYLPAKVVGNEALTQFPAAALPLIEAKTGVRQRRHADESECTSDLAAEACRRCLASANLSPLEVDAIILSTSSPDRTQPATATRVQLLLGADRAFSLDVNSVCSGALYALHLADGLIRAGLHKNILVVAAEIYSRILNPRDFSTYPYFGDGAGAFLLSASPVPGVVGTILHSDGSGADVIQVPAGGSMLPYSCMKSPDEKYFKMKGREVFDFAVDKGTSVIKELLQLYDVRAADIACFVAHQANINILRRLAEELNVPPEKFTVNLDRYGNTASASPLIALDESRRSGLLQSGGLCVMVAFGGGLSCPQVSFVWKAL